LDTLRWIAVALWLALGTGSLLLPEARAQGSPSPDAYVGIIVSRSQQDAREVLEVLQSGMDFGVVAKERSADPTSKDGGYIGRLGAAPLSPAERAAVEGVHAGEFTGIVPVPGGFAILTLLASPPKLQDLDVKQMQLMAKSAAVRQSINVAGMSEEDSVFEQFSKPDGWRQDLPAPCAIRKQSHASAVERMENLLAVQSAPSSNTAPIELLRGHVALAQLHAFVGDLDRSIEQWQSAYRIAQASVPGAIPYLEEALGVSYLHRAGEENGAYRDNGSIDIFPPVDPSAHYEKQEDSRMAVTYFLKFLDLAPDDLQVKWLLNLAYRTLGAYPSAVPAKYLISLDSFESKENIGQFTDVARSAGLNVFSAAGGVIVDDFDNDGYLDVISSSVDVCDPLHYFHNNGDGTFTDRTAQAGLSGQLGGLNLVQADYNNDGCMDVLVLRGGWEFAMRKSLLRNNCDGTFTDVTAQSGLSGTLGPTQTAAWADIDNDGYLDLFVGNENAPSQLFRNKGDGTFEDISHAAGVDQSAFSKGVVAADYDKDGYVDFYVSNFAGANFLYHNNHNLTFTDVARQAGVQAPYMSFATWFFDYDNDGWPDLFVTSYYSYTVDQVLRSYLGLPVTAETLKLYRNLHNGTFADVTTQVGLDKVRMPMGANFGDIDNDGYLDIYLGMGQPSFAALLPHVLLRNHEGKSFVDITASSGTGELHKGHGIAFADLARSGHEDIVAEIGGSVPSDKHTMRVFRNPGNENDWINVRLIGVKTNRAAVGAEIKVSVEDDGGPLRTIYRTVGDSSSFGANPIEQHIGLGHGARIVSLDVWWPASKTRQSFSGVEKNEFLAVKEFDHSYTKLARRSARLGGSSTLAAAK
jgi:tetratricopeptide (TPR) repeat protein